MSCFLQLLRVSANLMSSLNPHFSTVKSFSKGTGVDILQKYLKNARRLNNSAPAQTILPPLHSHVNAFSLLSFVTK